MNHVLMGAYGRSEEDIIVATGFLYNMNKRYPDLVVERGWVMGRYFKSDEQKQELLILFSKYVSVPGIRSKLHRYPESLSSAL